MVLVGRKDLFVHTSLVPTSRLYMLLEQIWSMDHDSPRRLLQVEVWWADGVAMAAHHAPPVVRLKAGQPLI